jgi:hypothetical protein
MGIKPWPRGKYADVSISLPMSFQTQAFFSLSSKESDNVSEKPPCFHPWMSDCEDLQAACFLKFHGNRGTDQMNWLQKEGDQYQTHQTETLPRQCGKKKIFCRELSNSESEPAKTCKMLILESEVLVLNLSSSQIFHDRLIRSPKKHR